MDLHFDMNLAQKYHAKPQIARILTEDWASRNLFCPNCGFSGIRHFENNRPVADFYCPNCNEQYELKSKKGTIGKKINGGAYKAMIRRITSLDNPNFLFMSYSIEDMSVKDLIVVPKFFFTPAIIQKRKPLSDTAERPGWTGCNILLGQVPMQGRISIIANGGIEDREHVVLRMRRAQKLQVSELSSRGWLLDVLKCINSIQANEFDLAKVYEFEPFLAKAHPENNHIKPKIRQQLQNLRDKGIIEFTGRGKYKKCS